MMKHRFMKIDVLSPPHCPNWGTVPPLGADPVEEEVELGPVEEVELGPVVVVPVVEPLKVEPMGPVLMFENTTWLLGSVASTVFGSPDVAEQGPRATPGAVTLALRG